jgi:GNAT superfamily N-acetyltransferase
MIFDGPQSEEFAFVFDSWARSFRRSPWAGVIPNHLYDAVSREAAKGIVDRPTARVTIAVAPGDTRRIMGCSIAEPARNLLHWLYVKESFRHMGIGRALLAETVRDFGAGSHVYTFRTRSSERFLGRQWHWDPVLARVK